MKKNKFKCCICGELVEELWQFACWVDPTEKEYCETCFHDTYDKVMEEYNNE